MDKKEDLITLVNVHFKDMAKTMVWFQLPNPQLGGVTPNEMIDSGKQGKLLRFIQTALDENKE